MSVVDKIQGVVALAAMLAMVLLIPLYLSQRRDLRRLRGWMARDPDHPASDLAVSETMLDRAESELELLLTDRGEAQSEAMTIAYPPGGARATPGVTPVPPLQRVASGRPALTQITMEREALLPHPRWRRFVMRATQTRYLIGIGIAAVILGGTAILGADRILETDDGGREPRPGAIDPADVTVTVLNGTALPGLAGKVSDDIQANGFELGAVTNSEKEYDQTVVMFEPGQEGEARKVAHNLGVRPLQPIDRQTRELADGADVVVIAGKDRAKL